jgi:hypothetical protein
MTPTTRTGKDLPHYETPPCYSSLHTLLPLKNPAHQYHLQNPHSKHCIEPCIKSSSKTYFQAKQQSQVKSLSSNPSSVPSSTPSSANRKHSNRSAHTSIFSSILFISLEGLIFFNLHFCLFLQLSMIVKY